MEKYDFKNLQVFEQLEDKAIDGQLDYSNFPSAEYKYFSKLAKLGYNNRNKGWDIKICLCLKNLIVYYRLISAFTLIIRQRCRFIIIIANIGLQHIGRCMALR